jgi:hypothetical protein
VFAPEHHWALWSLTLEEVLVAKDFGKVLSDLLSAGTLTSIFLKKLMPGNLHLAGQWRCNGGGLSLRNLEQVVCWKILNCQTKRCDPSKISGEEAGTTLENSSTGNENLTAPSIAQVSNFFNTSEKVNAALEQGGIRTITFTLRL